MREVVVSSSAFGQVQSSPEESFNPPIHWPCVVSISSVRGIRRQDPTKPLSKPTVDQLKIYHVVKVAKQKTKICGRLNGKPFRGGYLAVCGEKIAVR